MHKVIKSIYKNSKPIELLIITGRVGHTPRVLCRYEIILQWLNRYNPPEVLWEQCLPSSTALQVLWSTQLLFKSQITYKCVPGGGGTSRGTSLDSLTVYIINTTRGHIEVNE